MVTFLWRHHLHYRHDDDTSSKVKTFLKAIWNLAEFSFTEQLYASLQNISLSIKYYWYTLRSRINGAPNKQEGWRVQWNIISGGIVIDAEGVLLVYFDSNDVNVSKIAYVRTKLSFMERLKQCENKFFRLKIMTY